MAGVTRTGCDISGVSRVPASWTSQRDREAPISAGIEGLYRAHWDLVCGYLVRRTGDRELAQDLAQDTFMKATRSLLGWRGESAAGWLLSIARSVLIDHARRSRATLLVPLDEAAGVAPLPATFVDQADVRDALARLPELQRRLLELFYLDGFSLNEIAAMTDRPPSAVRTAVWRARRAFAETYGGADDHQP